MAQIASQSIKGNTGSMCQLASQRGVPNGERRPVATK